MRGSLFAPLSRYLANVLKPYTMGSSFVGNSASLVATLDKIPDINQGVLVSYDVEALYTSIPVSESLAIIKELLEEDDGLAARSSFTTSELISLIEFLLCNSYFCFDDSFFIMSDGVAMGSSLSGTVANIFMFRFERLALENAPANLLLPDIWLRYIDDVLARFKGSIDDATRFMEYLNSLRASIWFSLEVEDQGHIPFLDVGISKATEGVIFKVYRKPTHTGLYLNRSSCHPPGVFKGLVSTLRKRAIDVCSRQEIKQELDGLKKSFLANGFGLCELRCLGSGSMTRREEKKKEVMSGVIPFVPRLSQRIVATLREIGVRVGMRPGRRLSSLLSKGSRHDGDSRLGVVYRIRCGKCRWSYVGETGRTWEERKKEHCRAIRQFDVERSEVARHFSSGDHVADWEGSGVIDVEPRHRKRLVKEAFWTHGFTSSNRCFFTLSDAWGRVPR